MAILRRLPVPLPPKYEQGAGAIFATQLAERGQSLSFVLQIAGWFFVVTAGLFALLGTTARTEFEFQVLPNDKEVAPSNGAAAEEQDVNSASNARAPSGTLRLSSGVSNWFSAHLGIVFGACAIIFAGIGWQCLDRSSASALLATAATEAIGSANSSNIETSENADLLAYLMCVEAKKNWLEGRLNHDRIDSISTSIFGNKSAFRSTPLLGAESESNK